MSQFTPNVVRGSSAERYRLWRHTDDTFSAQQDGIRFKATVERDVCGSACKCGAFLTPSTELGARLLRSAERLTETTTDA